MADPLTEADREEVRKFLQEHWQADYVSIRGQLHRPHECEGFLTRFEGKISALLTFKELDGALLMLTQNSTQRGSGIGSSLVLKVIEVARKRSLHRVWLTTSNANLNALGFIRPMGFRIVAVHSGALDEAREQTKREIPEFAPNGLGIHDELELELTLQPYLT